MPPCSWCAKCRGGWTRSREVLHDTTQLIYSVVHCNFWWFSHRRLQALERKAHHPIGLAELIQNQKLEANSLHPYETEAVDDGEGGSCLS